MVYRIHGLNKTYLQTTLKAIRRRCNSPNHKSYYAYGGRGIKCLINSPQEILDAIGHRPSSNHTIDRINNKGHYSVDNIRWATKTEQQENSTNVKIVTYRGRSQSIAKWAKEIGISAAALSHRLKAPHWSLEECFNKPVSKQHQLSALRQSRKECPRIEHHQSSKQLQLEL